jgi:hypothetical protein
MTAEEKREYSQSVQRLIECAASELGCDVGEVPHRFAESQYFSGHELLPDWIAYAWQDMSIDAKAVVVIFAKELHDQNEEGWFKHW